MFMNNDLSLLKIQTAACCTLVVVIGITLMGYLIDLAFPEWKYKKETMVLIAVISNFIGNFYLL